MADFFNGLSDVLAQGLKRRANNSPVGSAIMGAYRNKQNEDRAFSNQLMANFDDQIATEQTPTPTDPTLTGGDPAAFDAGAYAQGGIVTKPTVALLGEHGPEKVVPLTDVPGAKVSPILGMGGVRTRRAMPQGPNAAKRFAPLGSEIPIGPNKAFR